MQSTLSKFSIYDHFGYILVGLYQISTLYSLLVFFTGMELETVLVIFKAEYLISLTLLAYLVGHLIQAISNLFSKWENKKKKEGNKDYTFVLDKAKDFFKLPKEVKNKTLFQYCYLFALSNDFSGHIKLFNSMYSLYRGFFVTSVLNILISIVMIVYSWNFTNWKLDIFTITMIGFSFLFWNRKQRFFTYTNEKTMVTFDILSKNLIK